MRATAAIWLSAAAVVAAAVVLLAASAATAQQCTTTATLASAVASGAQVSMAMGNSTLFFAVGLAPTAPTFSMYRCALPLCKTPTLLSSLPVAVVNATPASAVVFQRLLLRPNGMPALVMRRGLTYDVVFCRDAGCQTSPVVRRFTVTPSVLSETATVLPALVNSPAAGDDTVAVTVALGVGVAPTVYRCTMADATCAVMNPNPTPIYPIIAMATTGLDVATGFAALMVNAQGYGHIQTCTAGGSCQPYYYDYYAGYLLPNQIYVGGPPAMTTAVAATMRSPADSSSPSSRRPFFAIATAATLYTYECATPSCATGVAAPIALPVSLAGVSTLSLDAGPTYGSFYLAAGVLSAGAWTTYVYRYGPSGGAGTSMSWTLLTQVSTGGNVAPQMVNAQSRVVATLTGVSGAALQLSVDDDGDGLVTDATPGRGWCDNCPEVANPLQMDSNQDGIGNNCNCPEPTMPCNDGNQVSGDGCSAVCASEAGWRCNAFNASTELAVTCATSCGDGVRAGTEQCDDGNDDSDDGCTAECRVEFGWACEGTQPSVCALVNVLSQDTYMSSYAADSVLGSEPTVRASRELTMALMFNITQLLTQLQSPAVIDAVRATSVYLQLQCDALDLVTAEQLLLLQLALGNPAAAAAAAATDGGWNETTLTYTAAATQPGGVLVDSVRVDLAAGGGARISRAGTEQRLVLQLPVTALVQDRLFNATATSSVFTLLLNVSAAADPKKAGALQLRCYSSQGFADVYYFPDEQPAAAQRSRRNSTNEAGTATRQPSLRFLTQAPAQASKHHGGSDNLGGGAIAGIAIGSLVGVAVLLLLCCLLVALLVTGAVLLARRRAANKVHGMQAQRDFMLRLGNEARGFALDDEIPAEQIKLEREIGIGASGRVFYGHWQGTEIAAKVFGSLESDKLEAWITEMALLKRLQHASIIRYMGWSTNSYQLVMVTEYMAGGDLAHLLYGAARPAGPLPDKQRLGFAQVIASAVAYLHQHKPPILHRDLKSNNVLLDDAGRAKVADFGISRELAVDRTMTMTGTPAFMAPEILRGGRYTESADVYSMGLVFWELLYGAVSKQSPYYGLAAPQIVLRVLGGGPDSLPEMPILPAEQQGGVKSFAGLREVMMRCLLAEPSQRPSAAQVAVALGRI